MVYVGQTGTLGTEWAVQNSRRNRMEQIYNQQIDLYSNLILNGVDSDSVLNEVENNIKGFGQDSQGLDLLSWDDSTWNFDTPDDRVFVDSNQKYFTNVDLDGGTYEIMDEQSFTENLGMDWSNGKPYDVFDLKFNNIDFYDFVFAGTDDGSQANYEVNLSQFDNAKWGAGTYTIREVDTDLLDPNNKGTDKESQIAQDTLDIMKRTMHQWATDNIMSQLSQYKEGSTEYNTLFNQIVTEIMDNEGYQKGNEITDPGQEYLEKDPTDHSKWTSDPKNADVKSCQIGDYKVISDGNNYGFTDKDGNYYSFPASSIDANKSLSENIKDLLSHTVIRDGQQWDVSKSIDQNGIEWTEYTPAGELWRYDSTTGLSTKSLSAKVLGVVTPKYATINGFEVKATKPVLPNAQTTYTVTLQDGSTASITSGELEKSGKSLTDYVNSVTNPLGGTGEEQAAPEELSFGNIVIPITGDTEKTYTVGNYTVTEKGGSTRPSVTVTDKNGNILGTIYKDELSKQNMSVEDYIKSLTTFSNDRYLNVRGGYNTKQVTVSMLNENGNVIGTKVIGRTKEDDKTKEENETDSLYKLGSSINDDKTKEENEIDSPYSNRLNIRGLIKNGEKSLTINTEKPSSVTYSIDGYTVTESLDTSKITVTDSDGKVLGSVNKNELAKINMTPVDYVKSLKGI